MLQSEHYGQTYANLGNIHILISAIIKTTANKEYSMKFFYKATTGLNADIERHREKELELMQKIAELELKDDPMSVRSLAAYRKFLHQLQTSKADVVSKIGKK